MTLNEILPAIFEGGQRARRTLWSRSVFVALENAVLCIKGFSSGGPDDGKYHPWTITESDYFADDWEIVE